MAITEHMSRISGHMTITSGNVSHPEDEAIGSLVFWSAMRALILVSSDDLEADHTHTPLWAVQKVTLCIQAAIGGSKEFANNKFIIIEI